MAKVRIFALGGLDEDGKNMYVVENGMKVITFLIILILTFGFLKIQEIFQM